MSICPSYLYIYLFKPKYYSLYLLDKIDIGQVYIS